MTTELNQAAPEGTGPEIKEPTAPEVKPDLEVKVESAPEVKVEATGDAALDVALNYFAKQGLAAGSLALAQAAKGDFSILKATLAEKNPPGWEQYVAIAEQAAGRAESEAQASRAAALKVVVDVCGSPEVWAQVKSVIAERADASELEQINAGLKAGGLVAKATAQYMKRVYDAAQGVVEPEKGGRVVTSARGGSAPSSSALSPREYSDAVQDLARKIGANRVDGSKEYADLQRRRQAYRG